MVPPSEVAPAERLHDELTVLKAMLEDDAPTRAPSRFLKIAQVVCAFVDTPGRGLGSIMESTDAKGIFIRIGAWSAKEEEEEESSN